MRSFLTSLAFLAVALAATAAVRVTDVDVRVERNEQGPGAIVCGILRFEGGSDEDTAVQGLRIELVDATGAALIPRPLVTAASVHEFSLRVADAPGWSAETPVPATLTISLLDARRRTLATEQLPVGFRRVDFRDGRVFVNGAPIRLRGVTAPGGLDSVEARERAIHAWKRANVNALLVPAGADPADWLELCDRLGLYVVVECVRPADGAASGDAACSLSESSLCRPGPPTGRFAHHPSYLFCTGRVATVAAPAPMQAFLQAGARLDGFARPTLVNTALDTPRDRPILAVGLAPAPGDLARVWQEIYWHPRLLGAFLAPSVDATTDEVKKVYQPILIERRRSRPGDVAVRVTNRHHHVSLEGFELRWAALREGEQIQQGVLPPLALAPNAQPEVPLPVARIDDPVAGATYTLRLSFHTRAASAWAPAGHEIACEELPLDVAVPVSSNL